MPVITNSQALKYVFAPEERDRIVEFIKTFAPTSYTFDTRDIPVDTYLPGRKSALYRSPGGVSNIITYIPGKGEVYTPPIIDILTPFDEQVLMGVTYGFEPSAPASRRMAEMIIRTRQDHDDRISRALAIQLISLLFSGGFQPVGKGGVPVGLPINFDRDPANTIAGNYTADPLAMFTAAYDQYALKHGPRGNLAYLVGSNVYSAIEKEKKFMDLLKLQGLYAGSNILRGGNTVLPVITETMVPSRAARATFYSFGETYENEEGQDVYYMDPNSIILTSLDARRVCFYGGITVSDEDAKTLTIVEAEQYSDVLVTKNEDTISLRTQSRPLIVPENANHCVTVTNTAPWV
jgi:hypothetical protein